MHKKIQQYVQINKFLSKYSILQHNQQITIIQGQNTVYLIRNIQISADHKQRTTQLHQVINTLTQHQQFACKSILSLLDFQIIPQNQKSQSYIRAIYQYGRKNLAKQIQDRKLNDLYFQEDAMWGLLYSLVSSLSYLEQRNVIYGVIDPTRVFLDKGINIIDPSSTGINPYQILHGRLYSPQLLKQQRQIQQIDMFKSDVFVLGLLILQSALLKIDLYEYDQNVVKICLAQIKDVYSKQFCQIVSSLLVMDPSQRPSFKQILKSITDLFQISTTQIQPLQPLIPDKQDEQNLIQQVQLQYERQVVDILQSQNKARDGQQANYMLSDFQRTKQKFCYFPSESRITQQSVDECMYLSRNKSFIFDDEIMKSSRKSKRVYIAKQIKDKLIKPQLCYHSSSNNFNKIEKPLDSKYTNHKRSATNNWQHQNTANLINNKSQIFTQQSNSYRQKYSSKDRQNCSSKQRYNCLSNDKKYSSKQKVDKQNIISHNTYVTQVFKGQCRNSSTKKSALPEFNLNNKQTLFTKPQIMDMIKNDIKRIEQRKKNRTSVHFNYIQQQQKPVKIEEKKVTFGPTTNIMDTHFQQHVTSEQFQHGKLKNEPLSFNALRSK